MSVEISWNSISRVFREHSPEAFKSLNQPASTRAIEKLQKAFRVKLPATFHRSLQIHNGTNGDFLNFLALLSVDEIIEWLSTQQEVQDLHDFEGRETTAKSKIRTDDRWRKKWLPIAADDGGNLILIDLAPGPSGKRGQVIRWNNIGGAASVLGTSYANWLKSIATELTNGRFSIDDYGDLELEKTLL